MPQACIAVDDQPEPAIATANGLMSTPYTASSARCASTAGSVAGSRFGPQPEQPPERPQQEVARAAGRVDQPDRLQAELVQGRRQRAVEDELLDELRRLQQGVLLAGRLGEVLVQVAQEARVAPLDSNDRTQVAGLGVDLPPERQQLHAPPSPEGPTAQSGVLPSANRSRGRRDRADLAEDVEQVLAVAVARVRAEVAPRARPRPAGGGRPSPAR